MYRSVLGSFAICLVLTACSGQATPVPSSPSPRPHSTLQPPTPAATGYREVTQPTPAVALETAAEQAFISWAQEQSMPYDNAALEVVWNDGTYAKMRVWAQFRSEKAVGWADQWATLECRNVGGQWQCPSWFSFRRVDWDTLWSEKADRGPIVAIDKKNGISLDCPQGWAVVVASALPSFLEERFLTGGTLVVVCNRVEAHDRETCVKIMRIRQEPEVIDGQVQLDQPEYAQYASLADVEEELVRASPGVDFGRETIGGVPALTFGPFHSDYHWMDDRLGESAVIRWWLLYKGVLHEVVAVTLPESMDENEAALRSIVGSMRFE